MSSDTTPPISLGEQTKVRMPLLMLVGLLAAVASATVAITTIRAGTESHTLQLAVHDERLNKLEAAQADLALVKNDVNWIRRTLEQRDRRTP